MNYGGIARAKAMRLFALSTAVAWHGVAAEAIMSQLSHDRANLCKDIVKHVNDRDGPVTVFGDILQQAKSEFKIACVACNGERDEHAGVSITQ